jgi:molybdate transport repressor ModE-like protein
MNRILIKPEWTISEDDNSVQQQMPVLLRLLTAIYELGSLSKACQAAGVSYRYAWGLIRDGSRIFGVPLVNLTRGKGAALTTLGEKLVWADRRISARLAPILDSLAAELAAELERVRADAQPVLRIHASHGYAIAVLRDLLVARGVPVELHFRASVDAFASMDQGKCEMAGFHVSIGALQASTLAPFARLFKPRTHTLISLITRRQGLMVASGNPMSIRAITDLARPGVRFVNRQHGSGTRRLLDVLLANEQVDSHLISGYEIAEFTHDAVAAYIASGMADAGFGVEPGARKFRLDFVPLVNERYFLACRTSALATEPVKEVLAVLRGNEFRAMINDQRGLDSGDAGRTLSIEEAFPGLSDSTQAVA